MSDISNEIYPLAYAPELEVVVSVQVHGHYCTAWPVHATPILTNNGSERKYIPTSPEVKVRETLQFSIGRVSEDSVNLRHLGNLWTMREKDATRYLPRSSLYGALKTAYIEP